MVPEVSEEVSVEVPEDDDPDFPPDFPAKACPARQATVKILKSLDKLMKDRKF